MVMDDVCVSVCVSVCVCVCMCVCVCVLSPKVIGPVFDKPLAQAPTSDVNMMVWHTFVPGVQEFGL